MSSLVFLRSTLRRRVVPSWSSSTTRCINNQLVWPPPELKTEGKSSVQILFEKILFLDVVEVSMLSRLIQERLGGGGVDMITTTAGGGSNAGDDAPAAAAVDKTAFDLKLVSFDAKAKIKVIKEIRAIAGLGLKEAKELVEGAPKVIQKDIKMEVAEELKAKLEEIGAVIEIV